ncbi:MAG: invasion associated locus B family protein [Alphaproteobacteria bacterium]
MTDSRAILFRTVFAGALAALMLGLASLAPAIAAPEIVSRHTDWVVLEERQGLRACLTYGEPGQTLPDNVRRGDIYVVVTYIPSESIGGQVRIEMGYPLEEGRDVTVEIDGRSFQLFRDDRTKETAWTRSDDDDAAMIAAMQAGSRMVVRGRSARGTDTTDTYSLSGFTAATRATIDACRG